MRILLSIFLVFLVHFINAQEALVIDSIKLEVRISDNNEILYTHTLLPGETLYSVAKYFRIPYQDLLQINNVRNVRDINVNSLLTIPLEIEHFNMDVKPPPGHIPIIYNVKRKETLFKISHVYFPQKIQALINRNDIQSFSLQNGQKLIVAWWPGSTSQPPSQTMYKENSDTTFIIKQPAVQPRINADSIFVSLDTIHNLNIPPADTIIYTRKKGVAFWDKSGSDVDNLFVMHNDARENSYIRLTNPLTGRRVLAKVIMQIPEGVYTNDIDIVITPAVAKRLGALDSRFRIEMDYYE